MSAINEAPRALKIMKASAGSGKTLNLTRHFILLLFAGNNKYREILAVTFTNKATAEMKHRIMSVLKGLATGATEPQLDIYRNCLTDAYPDMNAAEIQTRAATVLRNMLHDYSRFSVQTIDKFVQKVVRSFTYELGIDSSFRLEMNYARVTRDLSQLLHQSLDDKPELLRWIIDYAREQIENNAQWSYEATLIDIAGAIFSENFREFEAALQQSDQQALFDNSLQRIFSIRNAYDQSSRHFFEAAAEVFNRYDPDPALLKGKSRNRLLLLKKDYQEDWIKSMQKYIDQPEAWTRDIDAVPSLYDELNPILREMDQYDATHGADNALAGVLRKNIYYLRLLKEMNDLLAVYRSENILLLISDATYLLSSLSGGATDNASFIWEKMGNRYRYFLFDEFQDTSRQQWQNFLPLLRNALSEFSGDRTDHLIVGDVKQSIYRWRSGDWRLLLTEAEQDIGATFVTHESLRENYRSAANIIRFNNVVFDYGPKWLQQVVNEKVEQAAGSDFFNSIWKEAAYDRIIRRAYDQSIQEIPPTAAPGGMIDLHLFEVKNNQHRFSQVESQILEHTADTLYRWIAEEKCYRPGQIGLLVRTQKDAVAIIDYLHHDLMQRPQKNAYQIVSGDALKIQAADSIQLLINALYLLVTPEKNTGIYKAACVRLFARMNDVGASEASVISAEQWLRVGTTDWRELSDLLPSEFCQTGSGYAELPLAELTERLIHVFGLDQQAAELPYIFAFRDIIAAFVRQEPQSLTAFLKWWEEEKDELSLPSGEGNDVLQVVTIHKSKGLAYDVVMLPFAGWEIAKTYRGDNFWTSLEATPFHALNKIPVPFQKELNDTALQFAYWEEYLMRAMDTLNELYVALTRTRLHLDVCLIGQGAKDPGSFLVSDIIRYALQHHATEHPEVNLFEGSLPGRKNNNAAGDPNEWAFPAYPLASHLTLQLNRTARQLVRQVNGDQHQRLGILAHEVLSQTDTVAALEPTLHRMQVEGRLSLPEKSQLGEVLSGVLADPALRALLDLPGAHLEEQTILSPDGHSHRPDKIILSGRQAVIIDYKFTAAAHEEHRQQLRVYRDLLIAMGYAEVAAYLYYGFRKELVPV